MKETIRSYHDAAKFLRQYDQRGTNQRGTVIVRLSTEEIAVRYHNTDVVIYHHPQQVDRVATMGTGGWVTNTTVSRINEYAPEGITVYVRGDHERILLDDFTTNVRGYDLSVANYVMPRHHSRGVPPSGPVDESFLARLLGKRS